MTRHDLVERIEERGGVQHPQHASQGPGQPGLGEERAGAARSRVMVREQRRKFTRRGRSTTSRRVARGRVLSVFTRGDACARLRLIIRRWCRVAGGAP
jgi:hypothetical protein